MTKAEEQVLKDFLLDINCLKRLDKWSDQFNIFDVLKITNMEIRHSNILAWLFDPNENHGLGDEFIKSFITKVTEKTEESKYSPFKLLLQDFDSYQVYRESNHMDIVLYSQQEKTAVVIENKVWAGESKHQLKTYMEKSKQEYSDCEQILYVFLTPGGDDASDPENWIPFSYEEIVNILVDILRESSLREDVEFLINSYIDTVRKKIMKEKDQELVKICNEIYAKHKSALRLIFENVSVDSSIESEILFDVLRECQEKQLIIIEDNNRWEFFTPGMDAYLPKLSTQNSSYGTERVYKYWFEQLDDKLRVHLELGGWNLTEELRDKTNALITESGKKVDDYRYKRLFHKDAKLSQNDYEESFKKAVKSLVVACLEKQKKWLDAVQ